MNYKILYMIDGTVDINLTSTDADIEDIRKQAKEAFDKKTFGSLEVTLTYDAAISDGHIYLWKSDDSIRIPEKTHAADTAVPYRPLKTVTWHVEGLYAMDFESTSDDPDVIRQNARAKLEIDLSMRKAHLGDIEAIDSARDIAILNEKGERIWDRDKPAIAAALQAR